MEKNLAIIIIITVSIISIAILFQPTITGNYSGGDMVIRAPDSGFCKDYNNNCGTWENLDNESQFCISYNYDQYCTKD